MTVSTSVLPGEIIPHHQNQLSGTGTAPHNKHLISTLHGTVQRIDSLVYVKPLRGRYVGFTGDVVIGQVRDVILGKWLIDIGSPQLAQLPVSGISSLDGAERIKLSHDCADMRKLLKKGDLIVCEIQKMQDTDAPILHTRSNKYGLLHNGTLLSLPVNLVQRLPKHMVTIQDQVQLTIATNGYVWIAQQPPLSLIDTLHDHSANVSSQTVNLKTRTLILQTRTAILLLAAKNCPITPQAIDHLCAVAHRNHIPILSPYNADALDKLWHLFSPSA